jgi:cell fate (sporulation/competence/biofilm development) regulator YmcA (YheA/YmcA/DUF963 family)
MLEKKDLEMIRQVVKEEIKKIDIIKLFARIERVERQHEELKKRVDELERRVFNPERVSLPKNP